MKCMVYGLLISMLGFFYSCADDKGNYDYADINKLVISGIESEYKKIAHVDTLRIYPDVQNEGGDRNEGDYGYEWKVIPRSAQQVGEGEKEIDYVLATTKDLDVPVSLDAGEYVCFYKVEDKTTGVIWGQQFNLSVTSLTTQGWTILCEQNGQARMDMIVNIDAETDIISRDIWSESELKTGKPLRVMCDYTFAPLIPNIFVCEKGSYMMDAGDMHVGEDNNIRWYFGSQPEYVHVRASGVMAYSYNSTEWKFYPHYWIIVDEKGDVYCNNVWENGGMFDFAINQIDGVKFEAAPFVANASRYYGASSMQLPSTMLYDKAGRFLEVKVTSGGKPTVMKFTGKILFSAEQPGKEMVCLQSTVYNGLTYAILKDGNGEYYYYGIILGNFGENTQKYYGKLTGPELGQAIHFACHPILGILYYATKDRVYKFDMNDPSRSVKEILHFPGETIKVMKFKPFSSYKGYEVWESIRSEHLVVGTIVDGISEDKCGIMRTYDFKTQWEEEPILKKEHTHLGKIVDIDYKEAF